MCVLSLCICLCMHAEKRERNQARAERGQLTSTTVTSGLVHGTVSFTCELEILIPNS